MRRLLDVVGLETFYGRSQALFGIDLHVEAGETVGVMGRNGMGKTTTLRTVMGLTPASRGSICIDGRQMRGERTFRVARAGLAIVPEGRQVFRQLTVHEHLLMARRPAVNGKGTWNDRGVYALFPRLAERKGHLGGELSGGEQQMLAIGRALMTNPRLLLVDEATEGLAPLVRVEIWEALRTMRSEGTSIIVVDKNVADMVRSVDRLYVLEKGTVAWQGSAAAFASDPTMQRHLLNI